MERKELAVWADQETRLQAAHLYDLVQAVKRRGGAEYTPFLSMAMGRWLEGIVRAQKLTYRKVSGFPEGERHRYIIASSDEILAYLPQQISMLHLEPVNSKAVLHHRQILGSLMGLGLKREVIGDIRPGRTGFYVAVAEEIAPFILDHWYQVGRERIEVSQVSGEPDVLPDEGEERFLTVNSPRLDAVLAAGFNLSRSVAQDLVIQGNVKVNDIVTVKPDAWVREGDLISCRGQGRVRVEEFGGLTRRGRQALKATVYRSRKP